MKIFTNERHKMAITAFSMMMLVVQLLSGVGPNAVVQAADENVSSVIVEDFEDGISDIKFNPKRMAEATLHVEDNKKYVRNGQYSARIDYDMIDIVDNPSQIEVGYKSYFPITGYPIKVGMWVYGNNEGHLLTTKFRESGGSGSSFQAEFYDDSMNGVNWKGWKYIEADIPQGKKGPIVLELFFQLKQSNMSKKNKGSIWVDDIRFVYEEDQEDHDVPVLKPISPLEDEALTAPLQEWALEAVDAGSGLSLDTLSVELDGEDITANVHYAPDTGLITYPGELIDGGYHVVNVYVEDNNGNPAETTYAFTIHAGERLSMQAAEEAVSNEIYPVKVNIKDYLSAETAQFELTYDPATLQVESVDEAEGTFESSAVDNSNGIVQVCMEKLSAAVAADMVTINFRVNSGAVLARGEAYKSIAMSGSKLAAGGIQTSTPLASPVRYTIAFPFHLEMTGVGLGTDTTFTVTDRNHSLQEGIDIYFTGLLKQSSLVTINAAATNVYEDDDLASEVLMTATAGQRYYASAEPDDGWFEVILTDGTTTGYVAESDVSSQPLGGSLGKTDANGQLTISLATLALGSYQVQAVSGSQNSKVVNYEVVELYGSPIPEYLQTYVAEDMSTQLSAAWQTNSATKETFIQYIEASEWGTEEEADASRVQQLQSDSELQVLSMKENGSKGEIRFHNVLVEGLKANTAYKYRIGNEDNWSAWYEYSTLDQDKTTPTSFLYITDSHTRDDNGIQIYQELMTNALTQYPSTQFIMHGGDMVDAGGAFEEWRKFWKASSIYAASYPTALTLGNHDVKSEGKDVFTKGANFPDNGPAGQKQYAYSYDIDDTHFVVLNSEGTEEQMIAQAAWLQDDLNKNNKKWTIAMFHRPAYHTEEGRDTIVEYTQTYFAPILEKMNVDLVLVGHDHVYARTYPMQDGKPNKSTNKGTVYLDGGAAGWKFYDGIKYDYLTYMYDVDIPVYSALSISQNEIRIEARTSTGELIDEYSIAKPKTEQPSTPGSSTGLPSVPTVTADKVVSDKEVTAAMESGQLVVELNAEGGKIQIPAGLASAFKQFTDGEVVITVPNQPKMVIQGKEINRLLQNDGNAKAVEISVDYVSSNELTASIEQMQTARKKASAVSNGFTISAVSGEASVSFAYKLDLSKDEWSPYTNLYERSSDGKLTLVKANAAYSANRPELATGHTYAAIEIVTDYVDLATDHWSYDYIQMLSAAGIVSGVDAERFALQAEITRAEFTAILARALQLTPTGKGHFSDVEESAWYADAVNAAVEKGILHGQSAQRFNPNAQISRQEMAVIIHRAYVYVNGSHSGNAQAASFNDMDKAQPWAVEAIAQAERLGFIQGSGNGKFNPQSSLTRAEAAKVLAKLLYA